VDLTAGLDDVENVQRHVDVLAEVLNFRPRYSYFVIITVFRANYLTLSPGIALLLFIASGIASDKICVEECRVLGCGAV
jgi:hypothetical protein